MTTRQPKMSLFYTSGTPLRWLRTAAAMLDERLATLCARHWQGAPLAAVQPPARQPDRKRLR